MFKADLHIHSNNKKRLSYFPLFYDSVQSVEQILEHSLRFGVNILSITDHDTLRGSEKAYNLIEKKGLDLILVPGCEISSRDGHILAYNITGEISSNLSAEETIRNIHEKNGIAVAAHPFNILNAVKSRVYSLPFDAVEGYNAVLPASTNARGIAAANALDLPYLANSDAHVVEEVGRSYMLFPEWVRNADDVIDCILFSRFSPIFTKSNNIQMMAHHIQRNISLQIREGLRSAAQSS